MHVVGAQVICLQCETEFTPRKPWQKFCSSACRDRFHNERRKRLVRRMKKHVNSPKTKGSHRNESGGRESAS